MHLSAARSPHPPFPLTLTEKSRQGFSLSLSLSLPPLAKRHPSECAQCVCVWLPWITHDDPEFPTSPWRSKLTVKRPTQGPLKATHRGCWHYSYMKFLVVFFSFRVTLGNVPFVSSSSFKVTHENLLPTKNLSCAEQLFCLCCFFLCFTFFGSSFYLYIWFCVATDYFYLHPNSLVQKHKQWKERETDVGGTWDKQTALTTVMQDLVKLGSGHVTVALTGLDGQSQKSEKCHLDDECRRTYSCSD